MGVSDIADWASIAALLISGLNTFLILSIKRRIVLNLTLDSLLERLRESSGKINALLLSEIVPFAGLTEALGVCEADVKAVRRRFGYHKARFCARLLRSMARYRRRVDVDTARSVYNDLQQVIQEVANRVEEMRITGP